MSERHLPHYLRELHNWVLYKKIPRPGKRGKFDKIPHYLDGTLRRGEQGGEEDRRRLAGFEDAVAALEASNGKFAGIGIAMLPESGIVGLDFDQCIDDKRGVAPW